MSEGTSKGFICDVGNLGNMSSSDSDSETPQFNAVGSQEPEISHICYGKLVSTSLHLPSIVLDKPVFTLGRSDSCDIRITRWNFSRNNNFTCISKNHFKIICDSENYTVSITDLSRNGTFVNGGIIGKNCNFQLKDADVIAIGGSEMNVYMYKTTDDCYDLNLPLPLQDNYMYIKPLGRGAYGEVILVREKCSQKLYAVKKVNKGIQIKNEVNILQSISHSCIIATKEVIDSESTVYIVLEYMEGGELTNLISSQGPLPENVVKILFYQLVLGLRYLHLNNITHRDLKPGNILLGSTKPITRVKIADFGLSKIIQTYSDLNTFCGTPCFIAPEVIHPGYVTYTEQVDIWSLGVMLFYMFSGELPFKAKSNCVEDTIRLIMLGHYKMSSDIWKSVSVGAKHLITKMLVKNPDDRYTIEDVANHPWLSKDVVMQQQIKELLTSSDDGDDNKDLPPRKKLKTD